MNQVLCNITNVCVKVDGTRPKFSAQVSGTRNWSSETCVQVAHTRHKKLVSECMAHEQSYWYQFLVPETWAENLGRVPWALMVRLFVFHALSLSEHASVTSV